MRKVTEDDAESSDSATNGDKSDDNLQYEGIQIIHSLEQPIRYTMTIQGTGGTANTEFSVRTSNSRNFSLQLSVSENVNEKPECFNSKGKVVDDDEVSPRSTTKIDKNNNKNVNILRYHVLEQMPVLETVNGKLKYFNSNRKPVESDGIQPHSNTKIDKNNSSFNKSNNKRIHIRHRQVSENVNTDSQYKNPKRKDVENDGIPSSSNTNVDKNNSSLNKSNNKKVNIIHCQDKVPVSENVNGEPQYRNPKRKVVEDDGIPSSLNTNVNKNNSSLDIVHYQDKMLVLENVNGKPQYINPERKVREHGGISSSSNTNVDKNNSSLNKNNNKKVNIVHRQDKVPVSENVNGEPQYRNPKRKVVEDDGILFSLKTNVDKNNSSLNKSNNNKITIVHCQDKVPVSENVDREPQYRNPKRRFMENEGISARSNTNIVKNNFSVTKSNNKNVNILHCQVLGQVPVLENVIGKKQYFNTKRKLVEDGEIASCSKTNVDNNISSLSKSNNDSKRIKSVHCQERKPTKSTDNAKLSLNDANTTINSYGSVKKLKEKRYKEKQNKEKDELLRLIMTIAQHRHLKKLLTEKDHDVLIKFYQLEDAMKYVIMYLITSRKTWYTIFQICNNESITNNNVEIMNIYKELEKQQFVSTKFESAKLLEQLDSFSEKDIKKLGAKILNVKRKSTKTEIIQQIQIVKSGKLNKIKNEIKHMKGYAIKIEQQIENIFFKVFLLATFLNPDFHDIKTYFDIIIKNGMVFPEVLVEDYPVFLTSNDFLNYAEAVKLRKSLNEDIFSRNEMVKKIGEDIYLKLKNINHKEIDQTAPHLYQFRAEHIYSELLFECCQHIYNTKKGDRKLGIKWIQFLIRRNLECNGEYWYQLIWFYINESSPSEYTQAIHIMIKLLKSAKLDKMSKYKLAKLGDRIIAGNKKNLISQFNHDELVALLPQRLNTIPEERLHSCERHSRRHPKYQVALDNYKKDYPHSSNEAGSLIKSLFVLLFWDIIYTTPRNCCGIFLGSIQKEPLDMFTVYFYKNRNKLINQRIIDISTWDLDQLIHFATVNWNKHSHQASVFGPIVNKLPDREIVSSIITCIGRELLGNICGRLAKDLKAYQEGIPNLLMWNNETKTCKFIAIKSNNDALSIEQTFWLNYLRENNANVLICRIVSKYR